MDQYMPQMASVPFFRQTAAAAFGQQADFSSFPVEMCIRDSMWTDRRKIRPEVLLKIQLI